TPGPNSLACSAWGAAGGCRSPTSLLPAGSCSAFPSPCSKRSGSGRRPSRRRSYSAPWDSVWLRRGAFPTDAIDTPLTLHGELHYVATAIVAGSMAAACLLEWHDGCHDPGRMVSARQLVAAGEASIGLFTISLVIPNAADPGLVERLAFVVGSAGVLLYARRVWPMVPARPSRNRQGLAVTMRGG